MSQFQHFWHVLTLSRVLYCSVAKNNGVFYEFPLLTLSQAARPNFPGPRWHSHRHHRHCHHLHVHHDDHDEHHVHHDGDQVRQ